MRLAHLSCIAMVGAAVSMASAQQPAGPGGAQGKFPPDKFVNLQVFPKDTKADVLIGAMKDFARGLGVRCQYCHVGKEGEPLASFDFVTDDNPHKNIARSMMRMAAEVNSRIQKDVPDATANGYQVSCYTCHRGAEHPQHAPEAKPKPPGE
jgi:Photosynthetic reaction centre cytochrome C subunit